MHGCQKTSVLSVFLIQNWASTSKHHKRVDHQSGSLSAKRLRFLKIGREGCNSARFILGFGYSCYGTRLSTLQVACQQSARLSQCEQSMSGVRAAYLLCIVVCRCIAKNGWCVREQRSWAHRHKTLEDGEPATICGDPRPTVLWGKN